MTILFANNLLFQALIDDLCWKCCILRDDPKKQEEESAGASDDVCLGKWKLLRLITTDSDESKSAEIFGRFVPSSSFFQLGTFAPTSSRPYTRNNVEAILRPRLGQSWASHLSFVIWIRDDGWSCGSGGHRINVTIRSKVRRSERFVDSRGSPRMDLQDKCRQNIIGFLFLGEYRMSASLINWTELETGKFFQL